MFSSILVWPRKGYETRRLLSEESKIMQKYEQDITEMGRFY